MLSTVFSLSLRHFSISVPECNLSFLDTWSPDIVLNSLTLVSIYVIGLNHVRLAEWPWRSQVHGNGMRMH